MRVAHGSAYSIRGEGGPSMPSNSRYPVTNGQTRCAWGGAISWMAKRGEIGLCQITGTNQNLMADG